MNYFILPIVITLMWSGNIGLAIRNLVKDKEKFIEEVKLTIERELYDQRSLHFLVADHLNFHFYALSVCLIATTAARIDIFRNGFFC